MKAIMEQNPERKKDLEVTYDDFLYDTIPLDESTRLFPPEKSHAQELLEKPIAPENRLAHLVPFLEATSQEFTAGTIGRSLGIDGSTVRVIAEKIGITSITRSNEYGEVYQSYPYYTYELVKEEVEWRRMYDALDDTLSSFAIGNVIARHPDWVELKASELEVYHTPLQRLPSGHEGYGYPKQLVSQLRHLMLVVPPAEDRLTVDALSEMTGKSKNWVIHQLALEKLIGDERRSISSGRLAKHYPFDAYFLLKEKIDHTPPAAGDWLTAHAMARMIHKDYEWVKLRLDTMFAYEAESRLDDSMREAIHYPVSVYEALKNEAAEVQSLPYATDEDFVISALAKMLGRDSRWVTRRLPYVSVQPTTKLNPSNNQQLLYYPEKVIDLLKELPVDVIKRPAPMRQDTK